MTPALTVEQFQALSHDEQLYQLEERGIFLDASRWTDRHQVNLFSLDNFYVEVFYHHATDTLVRFDAFADYGRLDPFLGMIDLTSLYARL